MKKRFGILLAASLTALALAGCGGSQNSTDTNGTTASAESESTQAQENADEAGQAEESQAETGELETIVVGASPAPHAEILKAAQEAMKAKGYNLEVREYTDYVQPNNALEAGDLDANYFQHLPIWKSLMHSMEPTWQMQAPSTMSPLAFTQERPQIWQLCRTAPR